MVQQVTVLDADGIPRLVATLDPLVDAVGVATGNPPVNTLLGRLKAISDTLAGQLTVDTPSDSASLAAQVTANALLTAIRDFVEDQLVVSSTIQTDNQAIKGVVPLTLDVEVSPKRGFGINCTTAGTVQLKLADNSVVIITVGTGWSQFPFAVKAVVGMSTTALGVYYGLV